jgi:hypothetical protein
MKARRLLLSALLSLTLFAGARADTKDVVLTPDGENAWTFTMPDKEVELTLVFTDGSSAVINVKDSKVMDVKWYDINGRKLPAEPQKTGVYIHDGKVVIVKK